MTQILVGLVGAVTQFFIWSGLVVALRGDGQINDPVPLVVGYVMGLAGWLLGVGVWNHWVREWLGMAPFDEPTEGWRRYLTFNTDHKVIGVQYLVTFVVVMLLGGALAMLIRVELMGAGEGLLDAERFNQVMSLHGTLMVAVAVAAVIGGFGNYIVPLMIGANDMAFPRLNALSFWLVPPVAVLALLAPLAGGFDSGWTGYPPLSEVNAGGQILFALSIITFGLSSIVGGLNILVTVATMRAPGMTWGRLPIFVWSIVSAAILSTFVTQFFAAALVMVLVDRLAGLSFFDATQGGDPVLYQHIFWFYSHPAVYIMILPGLGILLEVLTHFSRKPLFAYRLAVGAFLSIVGLSAIVWAHHMFTSGMSPSLRGPFMATTELISIPTGIVFLSALGTIWEGKLWLRTPMLFALAVVFNFLIGGITGIFLADVATDIQLQDTYFVVAHFHYTIMGGEIFAFFAGIYYWFPKVTGRMYNERLGRIHAVWMWLAFNVVFLVMFWPGINGMNRRIATYEPALQSVNRVVSVGAFILGASFLLFIGNMLRSAISGEKAPSNPWNARTLEWEVPSPPALHNFPVIPEVVGHPYDYGVPGSRHARVAESPNPVHA